MSCGLGLKSALEGQSLTPCPVRQVILTAPALNRLIVRHGNKAAALSTAVTDLIKEPVQREKATAFAFDVDKLGGRAYYGDLVRYVFPFETFRVEEEGRACSSYRIGHGGAETRIRFLRGGDGLHAHIALASMFSKYTRELFMTLFNRFWLNRLPGLGPTAGYPQDAARFLTEIEPEAQRLGLDRAFIRIR